MHAQLYIPAAGAVPMMFRGNTELKLTTVLYRRWMTLHSATVSQPHVAWTACRHCSLHTCSNKPGSTG